MTDTPEETVLFKITSSFLDLEVGRNRDPEEGVIEVSPKRGEDLTAIGVGHVVERKKRPGPPENKSLSGPPENKLYPAPDAPKIDEEKRVRYSEPPENPSEKEEVPETVENSPETEEDVVEEVAPERAALEELTVTELRKIAEEEHDLRLGTGYIKKSDLIDKILGE